MKIDAETYAVTFHASANLDAVIDDLTDAVSPVRVNHRALETSAPRRIGQLAPLLDPLELSDATREQMQSQVVANPQYGPKILHALLATNREYADPASLKVAKRAILAAVRKQKLR